MNLTADIGNTLVKIGLFDDDVLVKNLSYADISQKTINELLKEYPSVDNAIISDVTGSRAKMERVLRKIPRVIFLDAKTKVPFINNYGISLTWSLGSGFPFTPYQGKVTARNVYLLNNETKPYSSTVNLSMYKGLLLTGGLNLLVTLDVTNLFNRRNVNAIYDQTGQPALFGDADLNTGLILPWRQADNRLDPTAFGDVRQIILGLKVNWE